MYCFYDVRNVSMKYESSMDRVLFDPLKTIYLAWITGTIGTPGTMLKSQTTEQLPVKLRSDESHPSHVPRKESFWYLVLQVLFPFIIAGMGMACAGMVFAEVQEWPVYVNVSEIIILVPSLLGLKGNLEMTLASRLSTHANLGRMDCFREQWYLFVGNISLVQCQAVVVGLLSSIVATLMVLVTKREFNMSHTLLLTSCSIVTASVASFILGVVTTVVIIVSRYLGINPDNVATPIAGSLGDITALALLSWVANTVYRSDNPDAISLTAIMICFLLLPIWFYIAKKNKYTKSVLHNGWLPVIIAMLIGTIGGLILDFMVRWYPSIAIFQPVINGVGGNLVSILSSTLATKLHQDYDLGFLPPDISVFISPIKLFFSNKDYSLTARVLMFFVIPGHIVFALTMSYFQPEKTSLSALFLFCYLLAAFIQVAILLYLAYIITHFFWARGIDPDNSTIPYLTALGDLFGIILLGLVFLFLELVGNERS
ncbi:solute carrier family 41 member 1 isoform X2 [Lycorma delicatula]|uniref:solute carrier family 41 member 1 isoform X2 n=1 Tax=Lycorma delicatula TaxID=130591 RepID=UPI003F50FD4D